MPSNNLEPCQQFVALVELALGASRGSPITVVEIGVDAGATARVVHKMLRPTDNYLLYDVVGFEAEEWAREEEASGGIVKVHVNSKKLYDSYAWELLSDLARDRENGNSIENWDAAFLDGAHSYIFDAAAIQVAMLRIRPGGFFVLDDLQWTFSTSPTMSKSPTLDHYTHSQISQPHVGILVKALLESNPDWQKMEISTPTRGVFRKLD